MPELKRDAPIPAENVEEARPWRLPFWTEPPAFAVEREEAPEDEAAEIVEEPPVTGFPTAEELEIIRREAYNDGLEQGLVEGRQQGISLGREEGRADGHKIGYDSGLTAGKQAGNKIGYEEGRALGAAEVKAEAERLRKVVASLRASLNERDAQLPEVMVMLLTRLTEQVLAHELSAGAQAINRYVRAAINALPDGEEAARIYVAEADLALLDQLNIRAPVTVDSGLQPGECRVESDNSLVEYSVSDHLQQLLLDMAGQMLTTADGYPTAHESEAALVEPDVAEAIPADVTEDTVPEPTVAELTTAPEDDAADDAAEDVQALDVTDDVTGTAEDDDEPESPLV